MTTQNLKLALQFFNEEPPLNKADWHVVGSTGRGLKVNVPELIENYLLLAEANGNRETQEYGEGDLDEILPDTIEVEVDTSVDVGWEA